MIHGHLTEGCFFLKVTEVVSSSKVCKIFWTELTKANLFSVYKCLKK